MSSPAEALARSSATPVAARLLAALAWAEREDRVVPGVLEAGDIRALHAFVRGAGPWSLSLLAPLVFFAQMLARLPPLAWDAPLNLADVLGILRAQLRPTRRTLPMHPRLSASSFATLGFAETTAGIDREQARHADGWRVHAERAHAFILDAASHARHKSALMVGAGRAHDLPLAALAEIFERVVLLDVDGAALADTVATRVPPPLRGRIETVTGDVTMLGEAFVTRAAKAVRSAPGRRAAITSLARLCADCHAPLVGPVLANVSFDLVVSCLVMSQLHVPLASHARELLRRRFGEAAADEAPELDEALFQMALLMQQDHVDGLLQQGKLVALLSDVWEEAITRDDRGDCVSFDERPRLQLGATTLAERVPSHVKTLASKSWTWPRTVPTTTGALGARARVDALLLSPR